MPRNAEQVKLDRLIARMLVANLRLKDLVPDRAANEINDIRKEFSEDNKEKEFKNLEPLNKLLKTALDKEENKKIIKENFTKAGALAQENVFKILHKMGPKLVLPVLMAIAQELKEEVKRRDPGSSITMDFLEATILKLKEVDDKQNLHVLIQVATVLPSLTKKKVRDGMQSLVDFIPKIKINEAEIDLWFELVLWVEGHFMREQIKALATGNGKLKFTPNDPEIVCALEGDGEDEKLLAVCGVTKHFINSHFHAVAVMIEYKIRDERDLSYKIIDVYPTDMVRQFVLETDLKEKREQKKPLEQIKSPSIASLQASQTSQSSQVANITYEIKAISGGSKQLVINLPASCSSDKIAEAMHLFTRVMNNESVSSHSPKHGMELLDRLKRIRKHPGYTLFAAMKTAFEECQLAGNEDQIIHNYVPSMQAFVADHYTNSSFAGYRPTMFKQRTHTSDVDSMFESIRSFDDETGKQKNVLQIITLIEKLWLQAKQEKSSTLYSVLESLVVNICDHLILNLDVSLDDGLASSVRR